MASIFDFNFNNMDRIRLDSTDLSQRNLHNTRFANYTLSNFYSGLPSDSHVKFATQQPTTMFSGLVGGRGLNGSVVDSESILLHKIESERPLEKIMLMPRPFITVPYLGRGSCDTTLESQLMQGELSHDKKSVSTIMEKSFSEYALYPTDDKMKERVQNPAFNVEESALNGWVRGGMLTRDMSNDPKFKSGNRPSGAF